MSSGEVRSSSIFGGVALILVGALLLLHSYRPDFGIGALFFRWWPVLLIVWGLVKFYERSAARRTGNPGAGNVTGGEVLLVAGLFLLLTIVGGADWIRAHRGNWDLSGIEFLRGVPYSFIENAPVKNVPANSQISIMWGRGDIQVIADTDGQLRVVEKKTVYAGNENDAKSTAGRVHANVIDDGLGNYEIRPSDGASRVEIDLDVHIPKQSSLTTVTDSGDTRVFGILGSVSVQTHNGDIDIQNSGNDVSATSAHGDVHVVGAAGDVKVSGRGSEVEIANVRGQVALAGEFFGPIRMSRVDKGVHFASRQTELTLSQLAGRLETGSGNVEISDAQGDLTLATRKSDVSIENPGGRVQVVDDGGDVELRYPVPPRADISLESRSGDISISLPPQSSFQLNAQTENGDVDCDFPALTNLGKPDGDNQRLAGQVGDHGPAIQLRTQHGDIRIAGKGL